jgi:hypothetical protein
MLDLRLSRCLASGTEGARREEGFISPRKSAKSEVISLTLRTSSIP